MSTEKTITIMHIASGDLWAGAEVQLFTLCTALSKQNNVNVSVVLLNHGKLENKLIESRINVTVFDESELNGLQILRKLIHHIGKNQPDVIHTHRSKENILGSIAALFCGNIPTLRIAHGAPEHYPAWFHIPKRSILFLDWFCGRFLQKKIIAVSDELSNILKQSFPDNKISVIKNGIDIDAFSRSTHAPIKNIDTSMPYKVGIAGRLTPVKRIDLFIKTAHYLSKTYPEIRINFYIYGDGPLRKKLKLLNNELQTESIVHFEGHSNNLKDDLQLLDILLMTSDHEGLPMTLLEAMALQVPVIAHAVGGIPDLLDHGKCGELVDKHSAQGYAEKVKQLIEDPERRKEITNHALLQIKNLYSAEKNAKNYLKTYQGLIHKKHA